jgi:hypothetical protein
LVTGDGQTIVFLEVSWRLAASANESRVASLGANNCRYRALARFSNYGDGVDGARTGIWL